MSAVEVEVKFRVADVEQLITALARHGVHLGAPVRQDDQAYAPARWSYGESKIGVGFARLRTQAGHHTLTVKRPRENALSCDEHETQVADRTAAHAAILAMDYRQTVRIVKTRRTGKLGDMTVCVDQVEGLGTFVELERMVPAGVSGEQVQQDMAAWIATLGVEVARTTDTYDSLIQAAGLAPA